MAQYLTPGVYVEEVPSAIRAVTGVSTSTAGFVGVVTDAAAMPPLPDGTGTYPLAPVLVPQLVDSWETFKRSFGDITTANSTLARAVHAFFNNGGGRCWVVRADITSLPTTDDDPLDDDPLDDDPLDDDPLDDDPLDDDEDLDGDDQVDTTVDVDNALIAALDTFSVIDEIALVAIPGAVGDGVQNALLDHCENLQDRFAILDGREQPASLVPADIQGGTRNSSYGAIYFPWLDTGVKDAEGAVVHQPPSGFVAGVYARVDTARGVHKAPANEAIRGALGVSTPIGKQLQAGLNPAGINVIRTFGSTVRIWGARTLAGTAQPEWKYISSRRLFDFIRESIDEGTQWAVFEPNGPDLWMVIRRNITAFLTSVWQTGALAGSTREQGFYVICDETLNPPEVQAAGQLVAEIGVALVQPAEFVVFRISQWSGSDQ